MAAMLRLCAGSDRIQMQIARPDRPAGIPNLAPGICPGSPALQAKSGPQNSRAGLLSPRPHGPAGARGQHRGYWTACGGERTLGKGPAAARGPADAVPFTGYAEYCTGNANTPESFCNHIGGELVPGWFEIGGTSLSTPLWAAMTADRDGYTGLRTGNINPLLYLLFTPHPAPISTT